MTAVPDRLPSQRKAEPFVVELDRFQGPLDLLLHLIRAQDIDIFDIPISQITSQFHAALDDGLERLELDRAGEFLELAATLVRIKAQLLLPRHDEEDWDEDPRAELVRRLLEYELFQEVSHILSDAEAERRRHLGKGYVEPRSRPEQALDELATTVDDFLEAAMALPAPIPEPTHVAPVRVVTVEEKASLIRRFLAHTERLLFSRLFRSWRERQHVVASLLACLELAKQQVLRLEQVKRFGSIWLFAREESATGGEGPGDGAGAAEEDGRAVTPGRASSRSGPPESDGAAEPAEADLASVPP
ncbi:MAG: segregation/condensation protein A [Gemmatimonadota bacterium]|nr:segregation/condensation protein A [Gemmatimonadota bacterium]